MSNFKRGLNYAKKIYINDLLGAFGGAAVIQYKYCQLEMHNPIKFGTGLIILIAVWPVTSCIIAHDMAMSFNKHD